MTPVRAFLDGTPVGDYDSIKSAASGLGVNYHSLYYKFRTGGTIRGIKVLDKKRSL